MLAVNNNITTALSAEDTASKRTPIVIILGMHRSGTSLCAQILSLLGVDMASDIGRGRGNEAGHWERWEIVEFHDRILRILDREYYSGTHDLALPNGWWALPEIRAIQRELEDFIRAQIRPGYTFGFKDPRTARLLPLWTPIFRALNLDPRFVFCVRSPTQVARSLEDRDGLPLQVGEYRWAVYNTECWRNLRSEACTIVYDSWFEDRDQVLGRLVNFLSDVIDVDLRTIAPAVDAQIDRSLRHDRPGSERIRQPAMRYFYGLLSEKNQDDEVRLAISRFADQFAAFQQIIPFEGAVKAAADRDSLHATAKDAAHALEAAQASYAVEIAALRAERDEARQTIESILHENGPLRGELEAARGTIESILHENGALRGELEAARGMIEIEAEAKLHAAAATTAVTAEAAAAAAAAASAADEARRENEELRGLYAAAEQARDDARAQVDWHAATIDKLRRDNEVLRAQHAEAERQASAEIRAHQDAYTDLLNWIASFQEAVTASGSWRLTRPLRRMGIARAALPAPPAPPSSTK